MELISRHFPKAKVYLFGSRATGEARKGSDIDIAIVEDKKIEIGRLTKARMKIDDLNIPMKVDLVDIKMMPAAMQEDILKEGILWKK